MDDAIPDWLLIALGVLADLAVLYGGVRLFRRFRSKRSGAQARQGADERD